MSVIHRRRKEGRKEGERSEIGNSGCGGGCGRWLLGCCCDEKGKYNINERRAASQGRGREGKEGGDWAREGTHDRQERQDKREGAAAGGGGGRLAASAS